MSGIDLLRELLPDARALRPRCDALAARPPDWLQGIARAKPRNETPSASSSRSRSVATPR